MEYCFVQTFIDSTIQRLQSLKYPRRTEKFRQTAFAINHSDFGIVELAKKYSRELGKRFDGDRKTRNPLAAEIDSMMIPVVLETANGPTKAACSIMLAKILLRSQPCRYSPPAP